MNFAAARDQAARGRLYPSVILYGGSQEERQRAAVKIARALLCEHTKSTRPCPDDAPEPCHHCRRLAWPAKDEERFHPDLHVLERDLRTATSVAATRAFLSGAYSSPFEARGQVFVVAEAESLGGGAADSLLKLLEEPPERSPRNFLLLAPSRLDLLPTLRSRSLSIYLGSSESLDTELIADVAEAFGRAIDACLEGFSPIHLFSAADALTGAGGWDDPRARRPWATAAAAVLRATETRELEPPLRRALLALADQLFDGPRLRVRGIAPTRLLEGWLTRHLTPRLL